MSLPKGKIAILYRERLTDRQKCGIILLQVNVAHSFLYRFAVEHIFMPVECCRLLKLSHPFSKWTRPSPRTNQNAPRCSNRLAPFKNGLTKQLRL